MKKRVCSIAVTLCMTLSIGQCTSLTQVTVLSTARGGLYVGDGNYGLGVERGKYTRTAQQAKDGEEFVRSFF